MKTISEQSLYEILEIPQDAPVEEIEEAYQRAKALYGPGSLATYSLVAPEEMALLNRRIEEARRVLLDAGARAGYDATLPGVPGRAAPQLAASAATAEASPPGPVLAAFPPPATPLPTVAAAAAMDTGVATPAPAMGPTTTTPAASAPAMLAPVSTAPSAPTAQAQAPALQGVPPASAPARASPPPPAVAEAPAPAARAPGFSAPEGTVWTGEMLRRAREGRGLTVHQVAERTKVARHHLENVEADRYALLPAPVYLRGILISVAKELRLDPQKVSRSYLEAMQAAEAPKGPPKPR